ncbi:acyltransferase family protein [Brevibacterium sp. FAM 24630]|uniref:acyltransferase family protein n=1 Tax=Brevibacterium sp. FAM 24630 TaxID=3415680 RepID=UPI003C7D9047
MSLFADTIDHLSVLSPTMQTRDYRLDKAKGILIFLVVLGHLLEGISGWGMGYSRGLLTAIYSFHMPAFVLLAGMTAKSDRLGERTLTFAVLAVATQPIYFYWSELFGVEPDLEITEPYWITWFLLAMVWWTLALPLVERFPTPMLCLSLAVGIFGGILPALDYELSIGRTMTFFPFFVLGKLYGIRMLNWAAQLRAWEKGGLTVLAALTIAVLYLNDLDKKWFYGARGFEFLDSAIPYGVGVRVCIATSAISTIAVLFAWSEHLPKFLVATGQRSLAIYIIHGLLVRAFEGSLNLMVDKTNGSVTIALCIVVAVAITLLLSWSPLNRAIRWFSSTLAKLVIQGASVVVPTDRQGRH